jgi:hypothetical protein
VAFAKEQWSLRMDRSSYGISFWLWVKKLAAINSCFQSDVPVRILAVEMTFQWIITLEDEARYREFVSKYRTAPKVEERWERNVQRTNVVISEDIVWECVVSCLLTTQQKSGRGSRVEQFIDSEAQLLSFPFCRESKSLADIATTSLKTAGLRRTDRIAVEVVHAMDIFKNNWQEFESELNKLNEHSAVGTERTAARWIQTKLKGFGPKQSRNLLQWLGLSQHEIPLDSRMIKVLKNLNFPVPLSATALADENYYCFIEDGLQDMLARIGVIPCIFDACAFASFERD